MLKWTFCARRWSLARCSCFTWALLAALLPGSIIAQQTTAFVEVTVVPMDRQRTLAGQTVVVQDGVITQMGSSSQVEIPQGAARIDGRGRFLLPGLAEMHGHYPPPQTAREYTEHILFLYVANGITLVRGMQGDEHHLPLRDQIEKGEVLGPRLLVSAPPMSGRGPTEPDQARQMVRDYKQAGFDHLKVHEGLAPEVYDAIAETARQEGIPFAGHVSNLVGLYHALKAGQHTIDHLDNCVEALVPDRQRVRRAGLFNVGDLIAQVDESKIPGLVKAFRESGAGVVPTMVLWETFLGGAKGSDLRKKTSEVRYMPKRAVDQWESAVDRRPPVDAQAGAKVIQLRRKLLKALHDGGVPVLLGTDSPQLFSVPGFSIHREMKVMTESGLTPYQVLASGTRKVAEFYGAADEYGTVAVGRRADLILLNANPLEDVAHVADRAGVMVKGRWLPESEIQQRLEESVP